jgi:hypothetical protein
MYWGEGGGGMLLRGGSRIAGKTDGKDLVLGQVGGAARLLDGESLLSGLSNERSVSSFNLTVSGDLRSFLDQLLMQEPDSFTVLRARIICLMKMHPGSGPGPEAYYSCS